MQFYAALVTHEKQLLQDQFYTLKHTNTNFQAFLPCSNGVLQGKNLEELLVHQLYQSINQMKSCD
jgi:hypothetical protein